jgi:hypothetical protein
VNDVARTVSPGSSRCVVESRSDLDPDGDQPRGQTRVSDPSLSLSREPRLRMAPVALAGDERDGAVHPYTRLVGGPFGYDARTPGHDGSTDVIIGSLSQRRNARRPNRLSLPPDTIWSLSRIAKAGRNLPVKVLALADDVTSRPRGQRLYVGCLQPGASLWGRLGPKTHPTTPMGESLFVPGAVWELSS